MSMVDEDRLRALTARGWRIAVETNGTVANAALESVDWVCVSPKRGGELLWPPRRVDELKVVLPGAVNGYGWADEDLLALDKQCRSRYCFVQPQDPTNPALVGDTFLHPKGSQSQSMHGGHLEYRANVERCIKFVLANPRWRVGAQLHKHWHLP